MMQRHSFFSATSAHYHCCSVVSTVVVVFLALTSGTIQLLSEMVEEYKAAAAEAWAQGKYNDAIEQYTLAISVCPATGKDLLKTIYSNRSAAYMK
jgi:hypothetical protein